jgi:hypothetical protein
MRVGDFCDDGIEFLFGTWQKLNFGRKWLSQRGLYGQFA